MFKIFYKCLMLLSVVINSSEAKSMGVDTLNNGKEMVEYLPCGDMDKWVRRKVSESKIIGGREKILYEIADSEDIMSDNNTPYRNMNGSPWATSNVYARVSMVNKGVNTVMSEERGSGYCALLQTTLERVKVLGIINLNVVATGTIFLGEMVEPITSTSNGNRYLNRGIKFTKKPKALIFDYSLLNVPNRVKADGMGQPEKVDGVNGAEVVLILHKRWEDKDGNIYAKRVGMCWERIYSSTDEWVDGCKMAINYGDCTHREFYKNYMALENSGDEDVHTFYALNNRGEIRPIIEVGWGDEDDEPTHLMLSFSSGWGGAYVGSPGTEFRVDNVGVTY